MHEALASTQHEHVHIHQRSVPTHINVYIQFYRSHDFVDNVHGENVKHLCGRRQMFGPRNDKKETRNNTINKFSVANGESSDTLNG